MKRTSYSVLLSLSVFLLALCALCTPASAADSGYRIEDCGVEYTANYEYTGSPVTPAFDVYFCGQKLCRGVDYTYSLKNNTDAGTATLTVTGKNTFSGTRTLEFLIRKADMAAAKCTGIENVLYAGEAVEQAVAVTLNGKTLSPETDYEVAYLNNRQPGKACVLINGTGNYQGTIEKTFLIYSGELKEISAETTSSACTVKIYQPMKITASSTFSEWSLTNESGSTLATQNTNTDGVIDGYFSTAGQYELTGKWTTTEITVESINGVLTQVKRVTHHASVTTIVAEDPGTEDVSAIDFDGIQEAGVREMNLLVHTRESCAKNPVIKWSSSNSAVAVIDQWGHVQMKRAGTVTFTASTANGVKLPIEYEAAPLDLSRNSTIAAVYHPAENAYAYSVFYKGEQLLEGTDYVISDVSDHGTAVTVTVTGAGLFGGELSRTFPKFQHHKVLYRITAADCAHGTIRLSADRAEYGSTVEATAVPDSGYTCVRLTLNGQALTDDTFTVSGDAVVSAVFAPDSSEPMEGAGTAASPYLIRSAEHLAALRTDPSACYRLMNDVDYLGDLWEPVSSFTGTFDGNGYAISNITIHPSALGNCGFFGAATNAEIKNLTLRNVDIKLTRKDSSMYSYLGCAPLVGYANGSTISGCAVEQAVIEQASPYYYIGTGGLVGYASGTTIRSCMSSADITASQYSNLGAGGLVGYMDGSSSVDTCMAFGSVKAYICGGFVCTLESGKIANSCSYVSVASPSRNDRAGGFAASTLGTIQYCYCTGDVVTRTGNLSGCFAGYAGGTISNCWSNNTVSYTNSDEVSLLFVASKSSLTLTNSANVYGQTDSTYQDSYLSSPWTRDTSGHGYRVFSDSWFTPQSITLESLPERTIYALNEPVDLEETVLVLTFSSGLHMRLDAGAYASFDTSAYGASEVTVSCMNKSVSFPIRVCRNGVEILDTHDDYLTLAVNCEDDAVLVAAVYQSGKLVTTRTLDLSFSVDKLSCFLSSPSGSLDDCTVKVFLLDRHSVPKAPAAVPKG